MTTHHQSVVTQRMHLIMNSRISRKVYSPECQSAQRRVKCGLHRQRQRETYCLLLYRTKGVDGKIFHFLPGWCVSHLRVITTSVGILAFESKIHELITAAVQRRIYTELSPLPLMADPH